eukprot:COSAG06_NODE_21806_length_744_cov_1.965891_1_plen_74_part_10
MKLDPRLLEWASSNDNIMRLGYRVLGDECARHVEVDELRLAPFAILCILCWCNENHELSCATQATRSSTMVIVS